MQDREKSIEEMAKDLQKSERWYFNDHSVDFELDRKKTAENLYNAGYRKQIQPVETPIEQDGLEYMLNSLGYRKQSEGEWIKVAAYNDGILNTVKCSVCNTFMPIVGWDWSCLPYCPFCGAKMKGV